MRRHHDRVDDEALCRLNNHLGGAAAVHHRDVRRDAPFLGVSRDEHPKLPLDPVPLIGGQSPIGPLNDMTELDHAPWAATMP